MRSPTARATSRRPIPSLDEHLAIKGVRLNPPPEPLDEDWFDWTFNTVVPDERIKEKDHWFRVDVTTRLLNDPIDTERGAESARGRQHQRVDVDVRRGLLQLR